MEAGVRRLRAGQVPRHARAGAGPAVPAHRRGRLRGGVFTHALATTYPDAEITGMDVSGRALGRARQRVPEEGGRVRFVQADLLTHPAERHYDLAFCSETLYYLGRHERLQRAAEQLSALLVPDGVLVAVHPWPEADRLHGYLDAHESLKRLGEEVHTASPRPFAVTVYGAKPS
ncbi:class I SAM-dependent methyltransferase [Nonomuraea thailandensis]